MAAWRISSTLVWLAKRSPSRLSSSADRRASPSPTIAMTAPARAARPAESSDGAGAAAGCHADRAHDLVDDELPDPEHRQRHQGPGHPQRQTVGRIGLFTLLLASVQDAITLATLAAALAVYVPWLLLLLVVAVVPSLLGETHWPRSDTRCSTSWTPERRQLDYLRYIGASDISAKELKLGLSRTSWSSAMTG